MQMSIRKPGVVLTLLLLTDLSVNDALSVIRQCNVNDIVSVWV